MNRFREFLTGSLAVKMGGAVGLLFAIGALTVGGVYWLVQLQKGDAVAINVSGRQRMLTQRMTKFSLLVKDGYPGAREELSKASLLYNTSLKGLALGSKKMRLPPASPGLRPQLGVIAKLWKPFYSDIQKIISSKETGAEETVKAVVRANERLLTESNKAVILFEKEATEKVDNLMYFLGISIILGVFVSLNAGWIIRNALKQIIGITSVFAQIGDGNYDSRAEVKSNDELGRMAASLNDTLDKTVTLIQTSDERDSIQQSLKKLLEEVSDVADGNLTIEAEVSEGFTGAIADAFNFMIAELRDVIKRVQGSTLKVSSIADETKNSAEHLAGSNEHNALQIANASSAIKDMAASIRKISETAAKSSTVGQQSLASANKGTKAVQNTIAGMGRIRDRVQETAKRIKRLGESSQEIGESVHMIDDIAERTSILALNASIQAAMAGEAGRGFAIVAEEVERLAARSTDATKHIANLVKAIQNETNEAVVAMEESTKEVVAGSELAKEAGKALNQIERVSNRLAELIQSISSSSKKQAAGSETVANSMIDISKKTQETSIGTKKAADSINKLAEMSNELRDSVSTFKLPS